MNKNIQILSTNLMMPVNMNNMIEKKIPYFPLNNMEMGMANNDIENNKMSNNEYIIGPIYSIRFVENNGNTTIVILENENTINEMLESYLQKKGKVEIIGKNNKIYFMYCGKRLYFGDNTKMKEIFRYGPNPRIDVTFLYD